MGAWAAVSSRKLLLGGTTVIMSSVFGKVNRCPAECNLVLLGAMGSGKSALTVKFLTRRFIGEYDPYLDDIYSSEEVVDRQPVTVRVMDTCDKEGPVNSERYLSWANAFLVVYSIDNMESFKGCQLYLQTLALNNKTFSPQTPIILLGNKLDMDRYRPTSESERRQGRGVSLRLLVLRGVRLPGLPAGAARLLRGREAVEAGAGPRPPGAGGLREGGQGAAGGPLLHHPLLQGAARSGHRQAGDREDVQGSEQEKSPHAHAAQGLQDILTDDERFAPEGSSSFIGFSYCPRTMSE
ncbi:ras-like protein family member 12 isoform X1 [Betta splendens]|uniref:small monomeric GTPase n=1 Tax=Betta splendens TaxID=158456 RepID=A0A6P7M4F6_BETSP|nr:ras-like protein family member 12 isoform X1 [Betta splendens]